jgi:FkbM family methyltransferase
MGGSYGLWPVILSQFFDDVHTAEPHVPSRQIMMENLRKRKIRNVSVHFGAFSAASGRVGWKEGTFDEHYTFRRYVEDIDPCIDVKRIDSLNLPHVDLIVLNTNGTEPDILRGAFFTIKAHKPVVQIDHRDQYAATRQNDVDAAYIMADMGYVPTRRLGKTTIYIHSSYVAAQGATSTDGSPTD